MAVTNAINDIKDLVKRALDAEDNYNLLFIGPPASAKTLFLLGILEYKIERWKQHNKPNTRCPRREEAEDYLYRRTR